MGVAVAIDLLSLRNNLIYVARISVFGSRECAWQRRGERRPCATPRIRLVGRDARMRKILAEVRRP